jgi:hypothetical protein
MHARDYRDIVGGLALILLGVFAVIYAWATLNLGTVSRMGPGLFPVALGCILAVLGLAILVPALFRTGEKMDIDLRSAAAILGSILTFALLVETFGLIPAIAVLIAVASRADNKVSLVEGTALVVALSVIATLIFKVGLGLQVSLFAWPF